MVGGLQMRGTGSPSTMDNLRFADNLDGEAVVALGLPAPRLVLLGLGAASAWAAGGLPLPDPLRLGAAGLVALVTARWAWGRVRGVSLARWSWLALGYVSRSVTAVKPSDWQSLEAEFDTTPRPELRAAIPSAKAVAFVAMRSGVGCTSVCRAVASQLLVAPQPALAGSRLEEAGAKWIPADLQGSSCPPLLLCDWGAGAQNLPPQSQVVGLILVWGGEEDAPGALRTKVLNLHQSFPGVEVLAVLNRAGAAAVLSTRIASAGARLAATIPVDPQLGESNLGQRRSADSPSALGVSLLAREVRALSHSW
ncbi:MAG: hypothetical protein ACRENX_11825 [Candidatus Dormibacteria bacterium]